MRKYIVFRLYGPLSSWGTAAVGEERPTAQMPSRSALLGLLGAALGIKRTDEESQQQLRVSVRFGIKQVVAGNLLRDYHTTQVPAHRSKVVHLTRKEELQVTAPETILSQRDYRCDGMWMIAVWFTEKSQYTPTQLQLALNRPTFALYLGRKSCPVAVPLAPVLCVADSLKDALDHRFPFLTRSDKEDGWWLQRDKCVSYFWEGQRGMLGVDSPQIIRSTSWDEPLSRVRWQFTQRPLYQLTLKEA